MSGFIFVDNPLVLDPVIPPDGTLDVQGNLTVTGFISGNSTLAVVGSVTTQDRLYLKTADGTLRGTLGAAQSANDIVTGTVTGNVAFSTVNQPLYVSTNGGATAHLTIGATGKVGLGTAPGTSLFTAAGLVESTTGGYKFPDGTIQTTAAVTPPGGGGTTNRVTKFTGTTTIGDSSIVDSGVLVTVNNPFTLTGTLTLPAGTTLQAPLKFTSGSVLTAPVFGAVEFDGTSVYVTNNSGSPTRKTVAYTDSNITGNAATATALQTARNFSLSGNITAPTVSFDGTANVVLSTTIASGVIVDSMVSASAGIADTKLATIATAGKVSNSATTATALNTASAIVARDASGNFAAGTITATLQGNASTATALTNARNFSLTGNVTAPVVSFDGTGNVALTTTIASGVIVDSMVSATAAIADTKLATISTAGKVANSATTATSLNTASTIVLRDASGNFSAGTVTGALQGNASTATALATARSFSLTGNVTAPVISFDGTGNVALATTIASGVIVDSMVSATAAIADTKLATISTAGKVSNSATTATSSNTANTIVLRDASGNFSAGTITSNGGTVPTGTGSLDVIPRWTGSSALGSSILVQGTNATAMGVGVTPSTDLAGYTALEVGGLGSGFVNASNDVWVTANAKHSGGGWKYAVAASTPANSIRMNAGATIFNRAGNGVASNAITWIESARIDANGNFGIGTASPGYKLDVSGVINTTDQVRVYSSATGADLRVNAGFGGTVAGIGTVGAHAVMFFTSNTERARIDSVGNVGIGTSSPLYRLAIENSDASVYSSTAQAAAMMSLRNTYGSAGNTQSIIAFSTANYSSVWNVGLVETGGGAYTGAYVWQNRTGVSTWAERVRIDSAGNVGIGTTSPGYKLDVNGTLNAQNTIYVQSGSQGFITWSGGAPNTFNFTGSSAKAVSLGSNGVYDRLFLDTSGNVGIGTTSPAQKLDIRGAATFLNAGTDGTYGDSIFIGCSSYPTTYLHKIKASVSAFTTQALMTFSLNSGTSAFTDVLTLRGDGNVGIGTTGPSVKLDVVGDLKVATTTGFNTIFTQPLGGGGVVFASTSDPVTGSERLFSMGFGSVSYPAQVRIEAQAAEAWTVSARGAALSFRTTAVGTTTATERMRLTAAGDLGINTLSPSSKLHVAAGDIRFDNAYGIIGATNTAGYVLRGDGTRFVPAQLQYSDLGGTPSIPTVSGTTNYVARFTGTNAVGNGVAYDDNSTFQVGNFATFTGVKFHTKGQAVVTGTNQTSTFNPLLVKQATLNIVSGDVSNENNMAAIGLLTTSMNVATTRGPEVYLAASRSTSTQLAAGTFSALQSGDRTGSIYFGGDNGVSVRSYGALIEAAAQSTWSSTNVQSILRFYLAPSGVSYANTIAMEVTATSVYLPTASLGVGVSPSYKIDATATESAVLRLRRQATATTGHAIILDGYGAYSTSYAGIEFQSNSVRVASIAQENTGSLYVDFNDNGGSGNLNFRSNTNIRVQITSTGNLLIGTTSNPNSYRQVNVGDIALYTTNDTTGVTTLRLGSSVSMPQGIATVAGTKTAVGAGYLTLSTATGGTVTERVRVTEVGNVGINQTSPDSFFSGFRDLVVGNTAASAGITIVGSSAGTSTLAMARGTTGTDPYKGFVQYNHTADALVFGTSATEKVRVTSAGDVGIGTTSPSYKLDVNGAFRAQADVTYSGLTWHYEGYTVAPGPTYVPINLTAGNATLTAGYVYRITLSVPGTGTETGAVYTVRQTAAATWALWRTSANGDTSNHPVLRINVAGTGLEVYHNHASGTYTINTRVDTYYTQNVTRTAGTIFGLENGAASNYAGVLAVGTDATVTTNVKLYVAGKVLITSNFRRPDDSGDVLTLGNGTETHWQDTYIFNNAAASVEYARITSQGFLGIGTASPGAKLHTVVVDGVNYGVSSSGTTKAFRTEHNSTETRIVGVDNTLSASYQPLVLGGSVLGFNTNGTTRAMTIDASQNVGIGTGSPGAKLDVSGAARAQYGVFTAGVSSFLSTTGALYAYYTSGTGIVAAFADNSNTAAPLDLFSGATRGLRVDTVGNVGVGTTSISYKLHVAGASIGLVSPASTDAYYVVQPGTSGYAGGLLFNNAAGSAIGYVRSAGGSNSLLQFAGTASTVTEVQVGSFSATANASVTLYTNNLERVRIDSVGNVGIGTASPNARLEIASTTAGTAQFRLSNASGLTNWWEIGRDNATTGALIFASNVGEQMRITPAGFVGIGTASPSYKLDVSGSASAGYFRFKGGSTNAGYGEFQNSSGTSIGYIGNGGGGALSGGTAADFVLRAEANLFFGIGNTERARIDSSGNLLPGADNTQQLGSSSKRWSAIYAGALITDSTITDPSTSGTTYSWTLTNGQSGIFTATKNVLTATATQFFTVDAGNGAHCFDVTFVVSESSFSVAKKYTVVAQYGTTAATITAFKLVDTGPYSSADFTVTFARDGVGTGTKVVCTVQHAFGSTVNVAMTLNVAATSTGAPSNVVTIF